MKWIALHNSDNQIRKAIIASGDSKFATDDLLNRFEQCFVESTEIIPGVTKALIAGDMAKVGVLVDRSQEGATRCLGNQVPETIALAESARKLGAVAASAFGAGFGGSVWALLKADRAEDFRIRWAEEYRLKFPEAANRSEFFLTCAGPSMIEFAN